MFADDTTVTQRKKESSTMQPEIDSIADWMTSNELTINIKKCVVVCFGSGNTPSLKVKDTQTNVKYLVKILVCM